MSFQQEATILLPRERMSKGARSNSSPASGSSSIMFEDTLAYRSWTARTRPLAEALAFDLDSDAQQFYARMASDVGVLAGGVARATAADVILRSLLAALAAAPSENAAYWHRLYGEISRLTAGYPLEAVPATVRGHAALALSRMRQFLRENIDIAEALPVEDCARAVPCGAVRA